MGDIINLPNGPVAAKKLADGSFMIKTQNCDDDGNPNSSGGGGGGASLSDTIWTDDTNAYFVRRDSGTTITWTDISGTASSAPGTGARPASGLDAVIDRASYAANTGGTGFSTGDLIDHIVISDPITGAVIGNFWINSTTSAKITAPSGAALSAITQQVTVADGANVAQGAKADAAWSGTGSGSVVAILKALWAALAGTLNIAGAVTISLVQTDATSRSGTITTGGTAQVLMAANSSRKGWLVQNQSSADIYVRSRGSAGTTDATLDQNSVKIPSGAMYVADYITANALSIIGATTGQAFFAREW